jgi:hypothetical protein
MIKYIFTLIIVTSFFSCSETTEPVYDPTKPAKIIDFFPKKARIGDTITISCNNVLPEIDLIYVYIGGVLTQKVFGLIEFKKNYIQFKLIVPAKARTDFIKLYNNKYETVSKVKLVIDIPPLPNVGVLYPPSGCPGTIVSLSGTGFLEYSKYLKIFVGDIETKILSISDTLIKFEIPDITGGFDVYLKLNEEYKILATDPSGQNKIMKFMVGTNQDISFSPPTGPNNSFLNIKMNYIGNTKPRVFFGDIETEVISYKPICYERRWDPILKYGKEGFYDGYISCRIPNIQSPCKIKVITDCGIFESEGEFLPLDFKYIKIEISNIGAELQRTYLSGSLDSVYNNLTKIYPTFGSEYISEIKDNEITYYINSIKEDVQYSKGNKYTIKVNRTTNQFYIKDYYIDRYQGNTGFKYISIVELTLVNMKYFENDSAYVYYLNANELKSNINAKWHIENYGVSSGIMYKMWDDDMLNLYNITDSSSIKIFLLK